MAHCPINQEMDELLTKRSIEPLTGGAGFYSDVFVAPKCTDVYHSYSILNDLIVVCTYLLLRCLLSGRYGNLFNKRIMLFHSCQRCLYTYSYF